jgi:protoporphyrinogen oxidase
MKRWIVAVTGRRVNPDDTATWILTYSGKQKGTVYLAQAIAWLAKKWPDYEYQCHAIIDDGD